MIEFDLKLERFGDVAIDLGDLPREIAAAAARADEIAAPIIAASIAARTPVRTGFLLSQEQVFSAAPFSLTFEDSAHYASFVEYRQHFLERGVEAAEAAAVAAYEDELAGLAVNFGE